MIDFTLEKNGKTTVVPLSGDLDATSREYFASCMRDLIDAGDIHLEINCGRIGTMGSVVIGTLISIRKYATKKGGSVKLTNVNSIIADVLAVAGLSDHFSIYA